MDVKKVELLIANMESLCAEIKKEIALNPTVNVMFNGPAKIKIGNQELSYLPPIPEPYFDIKTIIDTPEWAESVPSDLLCEIESEDDKVARAEALLDMTIETNLQDKRFLDYGCGEGHMAVEALNRGVSLSVGFDPHIIKFPYFYNDRLKFTNDRDKLELKSYDVILLYDVLDHCRHPTDVLYHVSQLLAPGGTVYVVCHPWTSRHGGHLYRQFNKAFAHLWFDDIDFMTRGIKTEFIQRIVNPLKTYRQWFNLCEFTIRSENPITSDLPLERFFRERPEVWQRLTRHFDYERPDDNEIQKIFEIDFVSYVLEMDAVC